MFKRWLLGIANRCGVQVQKVATTWRGQPVTREVMNRFAEPDLVIAREVEPYTATSLARVCTLVQATRFVTRHRIPGAIVECGVWKGGSMMAVAKTLLAEHDTNRELFLFDTFEGMSPPTDKDRTPAGVPAADLLAAVPRTSGEVWCYAGLDEVKKNLGSTGYPEARVHYVRGRVEETLPRAEINQIAILRLDTDWYESTKHELTHLYPLLSPGGVLIIDDYGDWQGARQATDEYIRAHSEYPILLSVIDSTGRLAIKVPAANER